MFWLSFFKPQLACPADEFIEAIRQLAEMNGMDNYYNEKYQELQELMAECDFVVSVEDHASLITRVVGDFVDAAMSRKGYTPLLHQFKVSQCLLLESQFLDADALAAAEFPLTAESPFDQFKADQSALGAMTLLAVQGLQSCDLQRRVQHVRAATIPS